MAVLLHPTLSGMARTFVRAASREFGVPVTLISGWRSEKHNAAVGGAPRSLHLRGLAFDVRIAGLPRDDVPLWAWEALGEAWEGLGGRWGGRFDPPDVNHFDVG